MKIFPLCLTITFLMFLTACPAREEPEEEPVAEAPSPEPAVPAPEPVDPEVDPEEISPGAVTYRNVCAACHMGDGAGMGDTFPAIVGSPILQNTEEAIALIITGRGAMPPMGHLSDEEIADVLTYERTSFGNDFGPVSAEEVAAVREGL